MKCVQFPVTGYVAFSLSPSLVLHCFGSSLPARGSPCQSTAAVLSRLSSFPPKLPVCSALFQLPVISPYISGNVVPRTQGCILTVVPPPPEWREGRGGKLSLVPPCIPQDSVAAELSCGPPASPLQHSLFPGGSITHTPLSIGSSLQLLSSPKFFFHAWPTLLGSRHCRPIHTATDVGCIRWSL